MSKKIGILLLIIVMLFSAAFVPAFQTEEGEATDPNYEEVYSEEGADDPEAGSGDSAENNEYENELIEEETPEEEPAEQPAEEPPAEEPPAGEPPAEVPPTEIPPTEVPPTEVPPTEVPPTEVPPTEVPPTEVPPTAVPPTEVPPTEVPPTPEPEIPSWIDIDEDQVDILNQVFWQMTNTGRLYSGWFKDGEYAPCGWQGISCEDGRVVKLSFENAGYFTIFPEWILKFRDLKELRMTDTLVRGPLPETLFRDLPKLEKLELSGNFFTGEIPDLPEAFEVYPMLQTIMISDNLKDDRKSQLLYGYEYGDIAYFELDPQEYPELDLNPGLDGTLPSDWNRLPLLSKVDLSKNSLNGNIPDSYGQIPLSELNLSENRDGLQISRSLYDYWASFGNPKIVLEGLNPPEEISVQEVPPAEVPPVEAPPAEVPPEPVAPTAVPPVSPTQASVVIPTDVPSEVKLEEPTEEPSQKPKRPTATPNVIVVTATPAPEWYTATPQNYYNQPEPYYPPGYDQPYFYPTATPYTYTNPYWEYPTATPYSYTDPSWYYPTATQPYTYTSPVYVTTSEPTADPAAMLGFTYTMTEMTGNNIPMTWRYTGMTQYSINYLDSKGDLYPQFAMEWKPASELCNASVCNASVQNIPQALLDGGTFSLQLRAQDGAGRTYISDPVKMQVSVSQTAPEAVPTPEPEPKQSFWGGFFHWLFGPLIRLFGGS